MRPARRLWLASVALASLGPSLAEAQTANCSTVGQNQFVRSVLREYYYWYRELPDPDPAGFASPEAYLEAVRYRTLDASFSYISTEAESDAFFSESQFIGFGLQQQAVAADELRADAGVPGQPGGGGRASTAATTCLESTASRSRTSMPRPARLDTVFGPDTLGVSCACAWRAPDGAGASATLAKRR